MPEREYLGVITSGLGSPPSPGVGPRSGPGPLAPTEIRCPSPPTVAKWHPSPPPTPPPTDRHQLAPVAASHRRQLEVLPPIAATPAADGYTSGFRRPMFSRQPEEAALHPARTRLVRKQLRARAI